MLRSDLYDFSDAYIVVKGVIAVTNPDNGKRNKAVAFKNNAPFINCFSKINGVQIDNEEDLDVVIPIYNLQIDNEEDLDVVIPIYNLLKYRKNYRKTTRSLWMYYRDEPSNPLSSNSKSFKCKISVTGNTYNVGDGEAAYDANKVSKNETEVVVPLKYLSIFWRTLNIPLIKCKTEVILTLSKNCALADMTARAAGNNNDPPTTVNPTGLEFQITEITKLHVPVVIFRKCQKTFRTIKIRI